LEGKQQHGEFTQALLKALESDLAREDIRAKFFGAVIDFVGQTTQQAQRPEFRCNMDKGFVIKQGRESVMLAQGRAYEVQE
jgi:hypothetical protein